MRHTALIKNDILFVFVMIKNERKKCHAVYAFLPLISNTMKQPWSNYIKSMAAVSIMIIQ